MVNELSLARAHLRDCQKTLARHRRFLGESGVKSGRWTSNYEAYVVQALDRLWRAQCLEVFEDHGNGWFDSPACAQFVNNVDWEASAIASANLAGIFPGVIVSKQGGPW